MADKTDTLWGSVEAMPEYQAASPQEKMGYATYFLQKASDSMAGDLANNADAQELFRDRSKQFLFKIAEENFPNAIQAVPSQIAKSVESDYQATLQQGKQYSNTTIERARNTLKSIEGLADDEIVKGNSDGFSELAPAKDTPAKEYRDYLNSVIKVQEEKGAKYSEKLFDSFEESAKRTPSKAMMQWALSDGSIGLDDFISKNWKNEKGGVSKAVDFVGSLGALVLGANLESSVPSAKGMVAGIGTTLATGNPIAGGVAMGTAAANTEFQATYLSELQTELQARGGDVSAKAINDVLSDPEWNARVDKKAATRGVTIGATEGVAGMLSFGIAKAIGTNTLKRTLLSSVAGTATDMTGGSGGEFLARLFSGDDIWSTEARKDIVIEGLSEAGQGVTGVATELIRSGGRNEQGQQEASLSDSSKSEQRPQSPSTDEQQSATPPDADDAPVRSVLEEFKDPATEAEPAPEAATPVVETPAAEPAPVESPAPAPEETAGVADAAAPEIMPESAVDSIALDPIQLDDQLELRFRQDGDRVQVEKFNTETGNTIPFVGAEDGFASKADAVAFVRDQFNIDENADVVDVPDVKPIEETDELMQLLQAERMRPPQSNIAAFGSRFRREQKGMRAMDRDRQRIGDYESAPLIRDYTGEAADRLRSIYSNTSSNSPDQVAQMAYNRGLISDATPDALFDAIKQRLGGNLTSEASMTEDPESMAARRDAEMSNNAEKFLRSLTSPFRRGGMLDGRQLQEGDVLQIGSDRVTVGTRQGEVVNLRSERYGESYPVGLDDKVGFDAMEEGGIPVSEREATSPENVVTREETATLTEFIRQKLGADSRSRAVSSREHSALARSRKELEAARRLAKLFGRRIVGVENLAANGAVSRGDNRNIYIATDSSRTELLVVAHEMLHQLRQEDPELYDQLLTALGVEFDLNGKLVAVGADLRAYIDQIRPEHAGKSDSVLIEEFLADYLAERATDPAFWEGLAKRDPSMFERFVEFVRNFLYELANRIARDKIEVEKYLHDQAAMREALERTVAAFAARKRQADAGILDVPLSESLPFDEELPFADRRTEGGEDVRFADRQTKPNQQVFGQEIGREDEVQGKAELQAAIRENYFDSTDPVHAWSIHEAFRVLNDLEAGRINATADTGLDAANQTLIGELWAFGQKMIREVGDDSLFTRLRGRANDYFDREATRAARGLNARGWYVRQLDQLLGDVEKGKRAAVNKGAGTDASGKTQDAAAEVGNIQRDLDSLKVAWEDFTPEERAEFANFIAKNRGDVAAAQTEKIANALAGGKKAGARISRLAASKRLSDYLGTADSDMRFSDPQMTRGDRELMIRRYLEEQLLESKKRKRGVFIRNLTELGMSEEAAGARFLEAAEIREVARKERNLDAADAKAGKSKQIDENDPESVRRAIQEKAMAALDEESGRLDKLNEKARKISERLAKGPKKRQKPDPASKSELDRLVQGAIEAGDAFSREDTVKAGLRIGLKQEAASALADAVAAEIKNRGARKAKAKTISDRAKSIADRFNNPESRAQREPDSLRKLVNAVLRKDSTLTEGEFMAQAKALGVTEPEAADLWQALATERQKRAELRELLRMEREARKATDEAGSIIKRLAASQSDTQDNRPAEKREQAIRAIYQDFVSHGAYGERQGPAMSRAGFVAALVAEGVQAAEADMLATLATRERQNRLDTAHGKAAVAAVERSVPYIMREILAHPLLRSVGPEERLRIMARIFEDRAGMTPEKARAAAVQFDTQLKAKWEKAATELAEQYAAKRNSPFFRREGAVTIGKIFDAMSESRDVAPIQEAFERMIANGETKSAIASALEGMGVAKGTADRLATLGLRPERVQKTLFDKVREAVRAGALDPRRRVLDEVAKANGWVDLTETELRELSTLDAALDDKDLTDFEAVRIRKRMARIVNGSNLNPETKKLIREYLLANMFSGPRTWGVQLSTFFSQGYNVLIRDLAAAAAGSAMGSDSINLKGWTSAMMNWTNHVRNAVADGGVALLEGQVRGVQEAEIMNAISALEGVYDRNLAIWENPRSSRAQKAAAMSKVVFSSVRFFLRMLGGLDGLAQGMIRAWVTDLEQFSQAAGFGMSRKEIRQMVGEIMLLRPEFEKIADEKGFRGAAKMAYVNDRIAMAMHGALSEQGIPADVLESIKDRSFRESAMETGVNDFEKGTFQLPSLVAKKAVEIVHEGPFWVTWILPVIRTAFNLFHRGAWHGPYGLVRLANVGIKTGGFRTWKDADGKVLSPYENSLADPSQLARRSVEAIVGTAIWTGLIALIAGELEKDDEDRLFRINLGGPSPGDRTRFTAWRRDGRRPFTLQFRADKNADWQTHGFRGGAWEVFNFPLTLLGAWDQKDYSMLRNKGPIPAFAWTLWWELVGETFFPLRSMASRSNMVRSDQIAGRAAYTISSLFPASAALRTPMKFRDYQDHEGPAAAFASQIPVLQLTMEDTPRLNSLGDPIGANESSWSYVGSVFGVPVGSVPASKPWVPGTPATDDNVYQLFGKMDYFPGMVDRSDLPEDVAFATYRDLVMRRGAAIKKFVKDHYAQLAKMEPEQFKKEVRDFTTKATKSLKAQMKL